MELILKEDVINLGYKDDVVKVKDGYGRNYLIPTGKAVIATPSAKKVLAENLRQRAHKLAKIKAEAQELAAKLEGVALTIATKVSATGTIFGSVGAMQVAEELAKLGYEIDRKITMQVLWARRLCRSNRKRKHTQMHATTSTTSSLNNKKTQATPLCGVA